MSKRPVGDDAEDGAPGSQRHKRDLLITSSVPPDKFYTPVPVAARRALLTRSRAELASVRFDAAVHQAIARNVPLPTPSLAPRGVRRNFFKLRSALDYYTQVSAEKPLVFMYEECDSGRRAFLVTTMNEFWPEYCAMRPSERHYYEVIPEGAPCKLYFDLEFKHELNPEVDGDALVVIFKALISRELEREYSLEVLPTAIVDLRSSRPGKFSCHLIFDLSSAVFRDNGHAGNFVFNVLTRFRAVLDGDDALLRERMRRLLVRDEQGRSSFFVDEGVYTRNRALRIYLSSKYGSRAAFLPYAGPTGSDSEEDGESDGDHRQASLMSRDLFERSLVTYHADKDLGRLTVLTAASERPAQSSSRFVDDSATSDEPPSDLDEFVLSAVAEMGAGRGVIRSRQRSADGNTLRFHIGNNRFCGNVGRAHKSNHVYYDVRLDVGVMFQRCTDFECRQYRSPPRLVPVELLPPPLSMQRTAAEAHTTVGNDNGILEAAAAESTWADEDLMLDGIFSDSNEDDKNERVSSDDGRPSDWAGHGVAGDGLDELEAALLDDD